MKLLLVLLSMIFVFGSTLSVDGQTLSNEIEYATEPTNDKLEIPIEPRGILGKVQCKLCKEAMKIVEKEVNGQSSKEEIKKALDKACTIIPDRSLRRKCREAIEKRGDSIAETITENLTADNICKVLQYC